MSGIALLLSLFMPLGPPAPAPPGYLAFCQRQPGDCPTPVSVSSNIDWPAAFAAHRARLPDTPATHGLLAQVNRRINARLRVRSDQATYGESDRWATPLGQKSFGDCEDFVLEKRRALVAAGVQQDALSIALARTSTGRTHAVLLVSTTVGDLVLDNAKDQVLPWRDLDYRWTVRQAPLLNHRWVRVASRN